MRNSQLPSLFANGRSQAKILRFYFWKSQTKSPWKVPLILNLKSVEASCQLVSRENTSDLFRGSKARSYVSCVIQKFLLLQNMQIVINNNICSFSLFRKLLFIKSVDKILIKIRKRLTPWVKITNWLLSRPHKQKVKVFFLAENGGRCLRFFINLEFKCQLEGQFSRFWVIFLVRNAFFWMLNLDIRISKTIWLSL